MAYEPENPPDDESPELAAFLSRELRRITEAFLNIEEIILPELHVEPIRPRDGMISLADGTNWNPGSGAGFYGRVNGSWIFFG